MSSLKFLFLVDKNTGRRSFFCLSLKLGIQTFCLLTLFLLVYGFIMEYLNTQIKVWMIIKHLLYSTPLIISCFFLSKSTKDLNYFDAYVGYLILCWNLVYHVLCIFINYLFGLEFSGLKLYGGLIQNQWMIILFPQIFLIVYEFYFIWVCYSYTKNLSEGNDALVDGQNFDKYYENFASVGSTPKKSQRIFPLGSNNLNSNLDHSDIS
jgi:hypothetical protein